jgi:hypothetical protein
LHQHTALSLRQVFEISLDYQDRFVNPLVAFVWLFSKTSLVSSEALYYGTDFSTSVGFLSSMSIFLLAPPG